MQIHPLELAAPSPAPAVEGTAIHRDNAGDGAARAFVPEAAALPSREAVAAAVVAVNEALATRSRAVQFAMDPDSRTIVITLVDTESNRVLRQVPSQEILDIARSIDLQQHLLLRNQA